MRWENVVEQTEITQDKMGQNTKAHTHTRESRTSSLCTTAANPGRDLASPRRRPLLVCPEDVDDSTATLIRQPLRRLDGRGRAAGGDEKHWQPYLLSRFVRQHGKLGAQALQGLAQRPPGSLRGGHGGQGGAV